MFTKENVLKAKFINDDYTLIEVIHTSEGDAKAHVYVLEHDKDSADFQALEKAGWDLESIMEETEFYRTKAAGIFRNFALQAAQDSGLVQDQGQVEKSKIWPMLINSIFNGDTNDEALFALKLSLFEVERIRSSDNAAAKSKLRKSKNKFDVLRFAFDIVDEENAKGATPEPKKKPKKKA
jgi:hypothetical protein